MQKLGLSGPSSGSSQLIICLGVHIHVCVFSPPRQMDCSLKPSQRTDMLGRRNKGKRGPEENGGGPLSEPEEGAPHSYSSSCWKQSKNKRRRLEVRG